MPTGVGSKTMPAVHSRKRVGPLRKFVAGLCASVLAIVLNSAIWYAIAFAFQPPAFVFVLGGLITLGLIAAGLYTWAVDGPIVKQSKVPAATASRLNRRT